MARTKEQKKVIVEKVKDIAGKSASLVFVNVHGLNVADTTTMRRKMKSDGVGFFVAKKTLTSLGLSASGFAGTMPELKGEIGLAYGTDAVAPARDVYEFQKKFKDKVAIMGGVFEKRYVTAEEMTAIASIPSQQTLYGMFVNVINSPIQGLAVVLSEIAKKKTA